MTVATFHVVTTLEILKNKGIYIVALVFLVLINTATWWQEAVGLGAVLVFMCLAAAYWMLGFAFLRQLYFVVTERASDKSRLYLMGLLAFVLLATYNRPMGFIHFEQQKTNDVLVAERAGAANCYTQLSLYDDATFTERVNCFGIFKTHGRYRFVRDTIFFEDVQPNQNQKEFYAYAVCKPANSSAHQYHHANTLVLYKHAADTLGLELTITSNQLIRLEDK